MRCSECDREKGPDERGWMTVLSSASFRIHYCPTCVEELIGRASKTDEVAKGD